MQAAKSGVKVTHKIGKYAWVYFYSHGYNTRYKDRKSEKAKKNGGKEEMGTEINKNKEKSGAKFIFFSG